MHFFERYDFFNFQLFDMRVSTIFDDTFTKDIFANKLPTPHYHESWELYIVKSGSLWVDYDSQTAEYPANSYVFIPPYTEHCITHNSDEMRSHVSIRFIISESENAIENYILQLLKNSALVPLKTTEEIMETLNRLQNLYRKYIETQKKQLWLYPNITATSMLLFTLLLENANCGLPIHCPNTYKKDDDILQMIIEFIMMYASNSDITISHLAESLNYSVSQTNRILQKQFGKSFRELITEIRINKAKYYLTQTNFSIEKISSILGFKEAKNFNRSFKTFVGVTPMAYRRQKRNNRNI